jgi:hypothetical protein
MSYIDPAVAGTPAAGSPISHQWGDDVQGDIEYLFTNVAALIPVGGGPVIGGLVGTAIGPGTTQNPSTAPVSLFTLAVALVAGQQYRVSLWGSASQHTNVATAASIYATDTAGLLPTSSISFACCAGALAIFEVMAGTAEWIIAPGTTATDTFTVWGLSSAANLTVVANTINLNVVRVS